MQQAVAQLSAADFRQFEVDQFEAFVGPFLVGSEIDRRKTRIAERGEPRFDIISQAVALPYGQVQQRIGRRAAE